MRAETEMPGLMALRDEFGAGKPLAGARYVGCLHMKDPTGSDRDADHLGASVRWSSCNIFRPGPRGLSDRGERRPVLIAWKARPERN